MQTKHLPVVVDAVAPDGSDVRLLLNAPKASMAHFSLAGGGVSIAVAHRTLDELWYFVDGDGEMWRRDERSGEESIVAVRAGVAVSIPNHTRFQFRAHGDRPLQAVGVTLPPWPGIGDMSGAGECYVVDGPWQPTVSGSLS